MKGFSIQSQKQSSDGIIGFSIEKGSEYPLLSGFSVSYDEQVVISLVDTFTQQPIESKLYVSIETPSNVKSLYTSTAGFVVFNPSELGTYKVTIHGTYASDYFEFEVDSLTAYYSIKRSLSRKSGTIIGNRVLPEDLKGTFLVDKAGNYIAGKDGDYVVGKDGVNTLSQKLLLKYDLTGVPNVVGTYPNAQVVSESGFRIQTMFDLSGNNNHATHFSGPKWVYRSDLSPGYYNTYQNQSRYKITTPLTVKNFRIKLIQYGYSVVPQVSFIEGIDNASNFIYLSFPGGNDSLIFRRNSTSVTISPFNNQGNGSAVGVGYPLINDLYFKDDRLRFAQARYKSLNRDFSPSVLIADRSNVFGFDDNFTFDTVLTYQDVIRFVSFELYELL